MDMKVAELEIGQRVVWEVLEETGEWRWYEDRLRPEAETERRDRALRAPGLARGDRHDASLLDEVGARS